MQKNSSILLLIVVFSILLAGCQLMGSKSKGGIPDSSSAFKGSDGLVLSFFDDAPPDKVIPKSVFNIAVLLENKGAANIACDDKNPDSCGFFLVYAKEPITGITPSTGKLKDALEMSEGKLIGKESYLSGGRAAMPFRAEVMDSPTTTTSRVIVNACYPYKTSLSASVCVQTASYLIPEESRVCSLKTLTFSSQGAPVAITKIEQESFLSGENMEYVKPRLKIFIENVGKGIVLDKSPGSLKSICTSDATSVKDVKDVVGVVTIEEATISGKPLDCQSTGDKKKIITLTGIPKKDFVECIVNENIFDAGASNNLVAPLKIVLGYGYQTAISKEVTIEVLDAPPKVRTFSVIPKTPKEGYPQTAFPNAELKIYVKAEDDKGLDRIEVKDNDGKHVAGSPHSCDGALSCSNDFSAAAPAKAGELYSYKAIAVDKLEKKSDMALASGTVGGVIVTIGIQAEAPAETEIPITASAKSTFTKLAKLELIYSDGTAVGQYTYDCKSKKACDTTFKIKLPSKAGETITYKIKATDSEGKMELSSEGKVKLTAPPAEQK